MQRMKLFLMVFLAFFGIAHADDTPGIIPEAIDLHIVTQAITVQPKNKDGEKVEFHQGIAVQVLNISGLNALVTRWPKSPTFKPVWIPKDHLGKLDAFVQLYAWHGKKRFEFSAGDYSMIFEANSDGSFKISEPEPLALGSDQSEMVTRKGTIYKAGSVFWARYEKPNRPYSLEEEKKYIFVLMPSGQLCFPYVSGPCY